MMSKDDDELLEKRIEQGYALRRQDMFHEMVRAYATSHEDVVELRRSIRRMLPDNYKTVRLLIDEDERELFIAAPAWEGFIGRASGETGAWNYLMWFEDSSYLRGYSAAQIIEKNVVLTAIEKSLLILDNGTSVSAHYATSKERKVVIGRAFDGEKMFFTTDTLLDDLIDKTIDKGVGLYDKFMTSARNKASEAMNYESVPLVLFYSGTPALPKDCAEASKKALEEYGFSTDAVAPLGVNVTSMALKGISMGASEIKSGVAGVKNTVIDTYKQATDSAAQGARQSAQSLFCVSCGSPIRAGARFCPRCGTRVGKHMQASDETAQD